MREKEAGKDGEREKKRENARGRRDREIGTRRCKKEGERERERKRSKNKRNKESQRVRRDVIETQITLRNPSRRSGPDRNVLALIKYEV